ncbi:MAG: gliding motility-associated ABC transporter permease subunit GldF [Crocinitomicaceae bacterium]|nr:gliding motility-associated ABC transporter permease subunit GldF [Crocinitomicaceae bacterium]
MGTLLLKEISGFLNSLIGYVVMIIFLTAIGLFMWVFPGEFNTLDAGYANIDTLFTLAPWIFMFLAPAVTMRMFSEEQRTGTIELLLTKPVSEWQIIFSKYFAGIVLILFTLIPTLFYFYTVSTLGAPKWNVDMGAMWGSYVGLFFLSAAFTSIGLFASSISSNQIVSFILGVFLSFICFVGLESLSSLELFGIADHVILKLGINEHYISLSRGVIDTRDILYFVCLIGIFLWFTKLKLDSRKW